MCVKILKTLERKELAPRGVEPPIFRLTAEEINNISARSGVAYRIPGATFPFLVVPNPARKIISLPRKHIRLSAF